MVPAHGSTAEPWNRGPRFRLTVPRLNRGTAGHGSGSRGPRFRLTVPRLNRGNVSRGTGTVETVRFPSPPFSNFGSSDREQEKTREKHLPQEDEPTESTS